MVRVKCALQPKILCTTTLELYGSRHSLEQALEIISNSINDSLLRAVQDCQTAKNAKDKLKPRYATQLMISKIGACNTLLNK